MGGNQTVTGTRVLRRTGTEETVITLGIVIVIALKCASAPSRR